MTVLKEVETHINIFTSSKDVIIKIDEILKALRPGSEHEPRVQSGVDDGYDRYYQASNQTVNGVKGKYFKIRNGFKQRLLENIKFDEIQVLPPLKFSDPMDFLRKEIPLLPFKPYKHQLQAFLSLVSDRSNLSIVATGGGKSLIAYMVLKYFLENNLKCVLVVPTIGLTGQMKNDIKEYHADEEFLNKIKLIGGENNCKKLDSDIIISTWQSLQNIIEDIQVFDVIMVDECLHPDTNISTSVGYKRIKDLLPGDVVKTYNESTKLVENNKIKKVHKNNTIEQMYKIKTEEGDIKITGNHKVLTQRGWVRVDALLIGDDILSYK